MLFDAVGTRLNNTDKTKMLNVVRTILFGITQPETPQTCCKLWTLPAWCKLSSSCSKPVDFIKLQQVCEVRLAANWYLQTCCKLLQQLVDIKSWQICRTATCSKSVERINTDASCENQTCCKLIFLDFCSKSAITTCTKSDFRKLHQAWCVRQTCCKLIFSDLLQVDITDLLQSWNHKLQYVCWKHQCWYKRILLQIE